jgi:hypothetical protein
MATSSRIIGIPKEWAAPGEMIIRTISKRHTGGAMEKKDQPERMTDCPSDYFLWEEEEEDGTKILHDRERFSHELTLVYANGETQILTHEKKESE